MKRIIMVLALSLALTSLLPGMALAYTVTYSDTTQIRQVGLTNYVDVVGDAAHYNIASTSVTWSGSDVIIAIQTNNNGIPAFSADFIADLAIDKNGDGVWETGIVLKTDARRAASVLAGTVYTGLTNTNWYFSNQSPFMELGGYGEYYDRNNGLSPRDPQFIPVLLRDQTSSSFQGLVNVSGSYLWTITLNNINSDGSWNSFDLLWGSETCGNDVQYNHYAVPIPGAVWLLGSGLIGLVGIRRRFKK